LKKTLLLLLAAVALAQTQENTLRERVVAAERAELEAMKAGDMKAFADLLAEDAVFADSSGAATKEEVVKNVSGMRLREFEMTDIRFKQISPESGLIVYRLTQSGTAHGRDFSSKAMASAVWQIRNGKLLCVFSQETPMR
jgi:hypothetical protein